METEQMETEQRSKKRLKSDTLPRESYEWDSMREKFFVETFPKVATAVAKIQDADDRFDKDYIVTHKRRKKRDIYY